MRNIVRMIVVMQAVLAAGADSWQSQAGEGYRLAQAGEFSRAERTYRAAVVTAEREGAAPEPLQGLRTSLGAVLHHLGRYGEAEEVLREALATGKNGTARESAALLAAQNLAAVARAQGRYREAEELLLEVICVREREADDAGLAIPLNNLAEVYRSQRKYREAESAIGRALALVGNSGEQPEIVSSLADTGRGAARRRTNCGGRRTTAESRRAETEGARGGPPSGGAGLE